MSSHSKPDYDPVYLHTRRESLVILSLWAAAFAWVVPYCYFNGYNLDSTELELVWGIPAWVFWGVGLPWALCSVATLALCLWFIRDDDLNPPGDVVEGSPPAGDKHAPATSSPAESDRASDAGDAQ